MPIDRAPWNALIDDDGSNLVGSIWNKDKIKTVILDPSDVAFAKSVVFPSTTGVVNDWNLGIRANTFVQWVGASDLDVTGIAGGVTGHTLTIANLGSGTISLIHGSASSLTPNRLNLVTTSAPTRIAAGGTATLIYQGAVWILVAHEQGAWISAPFNAANFSGGAWQVAAGDNFVSYYLQGRTLSVAVEVINSSITAPTTLVGLLHGAYGGFVLTPYYVQQPLLIDTQGVTVPARFYSGVNYGLNTQLNITRADNGSIPAQTDTFNVHGLAVFLVN
jgi:hypothetical protein